MLKTTLDLHDNFSATIHNIIESVNLSIRTMESLHQSVSTPLDSSALDDVRNSINQATMDIQKLDDAFTKVSSESIDAPKFDNTWVSPNFEVFTNSGVDRFNQEILSTNNLLNKLNESQMKISNTASQIDILPDAMIADMHSVQVRIEGIKNKILEIENNPLSVVDESTNYQLESLRSKLSQAVDEQQALNIAVENMDIESANRAYLKLSNTIDGAEMHIRDNMNGQDNFNREQQALNIAVENMDIESANRAYLKLSNTIDGAEMHIRDNMNGQDNFNRKLQEGQNQANKLTGMIKGAVGAYLTINGVKTTLNLSDTLTSTTARLNLMNDGLQTTEDLQNMIYLSAERSRGAYQSTADAVSKLGLMAGDAFSSSEEIIAFTEQLNKQFTIAGTEASGISAAMLQLTQAMGSGVLRGEEYNSILEQAPNIIESIANYMEVPKGQLKDMAAEGKITAEIVKNAMFAAAEETNAKFESMPKTFAQIGTSIQNTALMAFQPVLQKLNEIGNSEAFDAFIENIINGLSILASIQIGTSIQNTALMAFQPVLQKLNEIGNSEAFDAFIENIINGLSILASMALNVFNLLISAGGFVADNWSIIGPIFYGIAVAMGIYTAAIIANNIAQGVNTTIKSALAASTMMATGATFAQTAAQHGLNAALLASPITWIVLGIIALITVLFIAANAVAEFTGITNSGFSLICGAINVVIQFFVNLFKVAANVGIGIGNVVGALAHNMMTAFSNSIANIQSWFYNLLSTALNVVSGICAALNKLPFINFDYSGITNKANEYANKAASLQENKGEYKSIIGAFNEGFNTFDAFGDGWVSDAFNSGAAWGDSIGDKFSSILDGLGFGNIPNLNGMDLSVGNDLGLNGIENSLDDIGSGVKDTAGNTGAIRDSLQVSEEDLKYLRDIAERETINRFTTAEINLNMGGITNNVKSGIDLDGIIDKITVGVIEATEKAAEGVHK